MFTGPHTITLNRLQGVDFTHPVIVDHWGLVIPLRKRTDLLKILNPFQYEVWTILTMSIPIYILLMAVADYLYTGNVNWESLIGFVGRTALHTDVKDIKGKRLYQKLFIITWMGAFLILYYAYAGTLTAMLATPSFWRPILNVEDLINQNEFSWIIPYGSSMVEYLKNAPQNSNMRRLYEGATIQIDDCFTAREKPFWKSGQVAAPCIATAIRELMHYDFTQTGRCNYYTTTDEMHHMNMGLPFQVKTKLNKYSTHKIIFSKPLQKGSPYIEDVNRLIRLSVQMGLMDVGPFVQNSTKCDSWNDILVSHKSAHTVELKLSDIYGMISLLLLGLLVAMASFIMENIAKRQYITRRRKKKSLMITEFMTSVLDKL